MTRTALVLFAAVLLSASLSGCGFQLRGNTVLPAVMTQTYLIGADNTPLYYELESAILNAGGRLAASEAEASATLRIVGHRFDQRERGVDLQGRTNAYEYRLQLVFSLHDRDGRVLAESESINIYRDQRFNPDQVLAMGEEQEMVREEMRRQAVQQLMRRLQALSQENH